MSHRKLKTEQAQPWLFFTRWPLCLRNWGSQGPQNNLKVHRITKFKRRITNQVCEKKFICSVTPWTGTPNKNWQYNYLGTTFCDASLSPCKVIFQLPAWSIKIENALGITVITRKTRINTAHYAVVWITLNEPISFISSSYSCSGLNRT